MKVSEQEPWSGTLKEFMMLFRYSLKSLCEKELRISRGAGQRIMRGEQSPAFCRAFVARFPNIDLTDVDLKPEFVKFPKFVNENISVNLDVVLAELDRTREQIDYMTQYVSQIKFMVETGKLPQTNDDEVEKELNFEDEETETEFIDIDDSYALDGVDDLIDF